MGSMAFALDSNIDHSASVTDRDCVGRYCRGLNTYEHSGSLIPSLAIVSDAANRPHDETSIHLRHMHYGFSCRGAGGSFDSPKMRWAVLRFALVGAAGECWYVFLGEEYELQSMDRAILRQDAVFYVGVKMMAPVNILMHYPCPFGLQVILTVAQHASTYGGCQ